MGRVTVESPGIVSEYVRERLFAETRTRGVAIAISRETGISHAHISNVAHGKNPAGEKLAHAMARHWGMSYAELEGAAAEHAGVAAEPAPDPERRTARAAARLMGISPATIARVDAASAQPDRDRWWWLRIYESAHELEQLQTPAAVIQGMADTQESVERTRPRLPKRR